MVLTMQYKLVNVLTRVGLFLNFWSKASDKLCAGSVDMINTYVI